MDFLKVSGLYKNEGGEPVLRGISFEQPVSRKLAVVGESGSGKSTLLKVIGGLAQPDGGGVFFEGKRVIGPFDTLIPGHPGIAYLSQHFELRNNYRVEEILEYANMLSEKEAGRLYELGRIGHLLKRRTDQLSGGERQRVALTRLLIGSPRLLLLDEPFSNLDRIHRKILQSVLHDIGEQLSITFLQVSHDPADALSWADEILVIREGRLLQHNVPEEVYRRPVDEYTGGLFGSYNLIGPVGGSVFPVLSGLETKGRSFFVRPEGLAIGPGHALSREGRVTGWRFLGRSYEVQVEVDMGMEAGGGGRKEGGKGEEKKGEEKRGEGVELEGGGGGRQGAAFTLLVNTEGPRPVIGDRVHVSLDPGAIWWV